MTDSLVEYAREEAAEVILSSRSSLIALSELLYAEPETAWQEHRSVQRVAQPLAEAGFAVEQQYLGLDTSFRATFGSGSQRVGICAEYDALPGLGHACGHNLISAISVGAACALAAVADRLDLSVEVYGTPAEEGGGGKIEMLERGAFLGLDLAMMAHPAPVDVVEAKPYAVTHSAVSYRGKAAHAAAYPELGVNAADAFTVAQVALGLLRQQLPSSARVHGIVTQAGVAPNAIPDYAHGRWYVRADSLLELEELEAKVLRCFQAGALATGCTLEIEPESKPYSEFRTDVKTLDLYRTNIIQRGRHPLTSGSEIRMRRASTDMGNVSQIVPAIHPYIGINSWPVLNHQKEFADYCVGPAANAALVDAATALAWTAIDRFSLHDSTV